MCGKSSGVGSGCSKTKELLDPQTLLDRILNDDEERRRLNEDPGRPGQVFDPKVPPNPRRDPNAGDQPNDPAPPVRTPRDPGGPGTGTEARDPVGPPGGSTRVDPTTGGGVSGLAATEPPRDPMTRGNGLLPSNAMLSRTAAIDYLGARGRNDLAGALRSPMST